MANQLKRCSPRRLHPAKSRTIQNQAPHRSTTKLRADNGSCFCTLCGREPLPPQRITPKLQPTIHAGANTTNPSQPDAGIHASQRRIPADTPQVVTSGRFALSAVWPVGPGHWWMSPDKSRCDLSLFPVLYFLFFFFLSELHKILSLIIIHRI
ncbi:hypothetical protein Q7C36_000037 [Tachysurus vachellii]|uniref:Uncharacterized protein n=1 Tax=Tachysurus vachellii TaxID=175792 RepID=A0AA88NWX9_TACVA|nr:hypothetical protein Q7C36_000037 [Tachysurus vachellii]